MIFNLLRWIIPITLLILSYRHIGAAATILLSWFFIQFEAVWFWLRIKPAVADTLPVELVTELSLMQLKFDSSPLTLGDYSLLQKMQTGDAESFIKFLDARCLDKEFNFRNVPVKLVPFLADLIARRYSVKKNNAIDFTGLETDQKIH